MKSAVLLVLAACGAPSVPGQSDDENAGDAAIGPGEEQAPDPAPGDGVIDPPSSTLHDNGCAGTDWQLIAGWVIRAHGSPMMTPAGEMERCIARYAGWVTNQADAAKVSRGTVYAALAATGQCDDGAAYTGAMLSGAQCAAVNPGVAPADCAAHMASSKSFGITTLAAALAKHDGDPPLTGAWLATGAVACNASMSWKLDAPAGFVDHYVGAYNAYHAVSTPLPHCSKHLVMSVALYTGMGKPGVAGVAEANGCWTYERVSKSNDEWKICNFDGTVFHADGAKWAYDDTNTLNNATTEASRISACASTPVGGYIFMANRGAGWRSVTSTHVRAHFAELYSSQFAIDDQFTEWKSGGSPGQPMVNFGEPTTTAAQISASTTRTCAELTDQQWFGVYVYPQSLDDDRLSALVTALNAATD